jgi:peroxiredoxin
MPSLPLLAAAALAASPAPLSVGLHALLFSLPAVNEDAAMDAVGRSQIGLSDFVGMDPPHESKAVVLHFFDRDHGGADLASLDRIQRRYGSRGVQVLGVSTDSGDMGGLSTWLEDQKLGFPVLRDNHQVVSGRYGIEKLPLTVVVDAKGYVFAIGQPKGDAVETELQAELEPLLGK